MKGAEMPSKLAPRQKEICDLIAQGKSNAQIARLLGVALSTVKNAVQAIFDKVGASDRAELARMTSGERYEFSPEGERCALLYLQGLLHARIQSGQGQRSPG
jgi:DNA-binding CsgD family transcriptional regulator